MGRRGTRFPDDGGRHPPLVEHVMRVSDREQAILDELAVIPDPHERLAYLVRRAARRATLPPPECVDGALVPGCVSRVWVVGTLVDGRCHFRVAADSPMVLGLVGLLCEVYEGLAPSEAAGSATAIFERAGLARSISPTRLNGLAHGQARLRGLAAAMAAGDGADRPSAGSAGGRHDVD